MGGVKKLTNKAIAGDFNWARLVHFCHSRWFAFPKHTHTHIHTEQQTNDREAFDLSDNNTWLKHTYLQHANDTTGRGQFNLLVWRIPTYMGYRVANEFARLSFLSIIDGRSYSVTFHRLMLKRMLYPWPSMVYMRSTVWIGLIDIDWVWLLAAEFKVTTKFVYWNRTIELYLQNWLADTN